MGHHDPEQFLSQYQSKDSPMSIHHQLAIRATRAQVYRHLSQPDLIGSWWGEQTLIDTPEGQFMTHQAGPYGTVRLQVLEHLQDTRGVWACVGQYPPENPASAWPGTQFIFDLSEGESGAALVERACSAEPPAQLCTLDFQHVHYDLRGRFAGFNNQAWGQVLQALKQVCEQAAP